MCAHAPGTLSPSSPRAFRPSSELGAPNRSSPRGLWGHTCVLPTRSGGIWVFPIRSGPPSAPQALTPGSSPATAQCPQLMRTWPLVPWPLVPWSLVPPWWQGPAPRRASRAPPGCWGSPYLTLEAAGERKGHGRAGSDSESCYVCFFFPLFCFILGKFPTTRLHPRSIQTPEGAARACGRGDRAGEGEAEHKTS